MKLYFSSILSPPYHWTYRKHQVHGVRCVEVTHENQECGEADGFWTRHPGIKVGVNTADCVPILLSRSDGRAVAALHAGWRGTLANIVEHFFSSLPPELARAQEWQAVLGPSIRPNCYEVSTEIIDHFLKAFPDLDQKKLEPATRQLDLIAVNRFQLERVGVSLIEVHPDCTYCSRETSGEYRYHSYRRGDRYSRQYSWIEISGDSQSADAESN